MLANSLRRNPFTHTPNPAHLSRLYWSPIPSHASHLETSWAGCPFVLAEVPWVCGQLLPLTMPGCGETAVETFLYTRHKALSTPNAEFGGNNPMKSRSPDHVMKSYLPYSNMSQEGRVGGGMQRQQHQADNIDLAPIGSRGPCGVPRGCLDVHAYKTNPYHYQ